MNEAEEEAFNQIKNQKLVNKIKIDYFFGPFLFYYFIFS